MKALIVSGGDSAIFPLAQDLILSMKRWPQINMVRAFLDMGLRDIEKVWLRRQGVQHIYTLNEEQIAPFSRDSLDAFHPIQRAKLMLPDLFPDFDLYLWLDADIWVQNPVGIQLYIQGASELNKLTITPEIHRCYRSIYNTQVAPGFKDDIFFPVFGRKAAKQVLGRPQINTGAFALGRDTPIWAQWRQALALLLKHSQHFMIEQFALNYLVYTQQIPQPLFLPSWCNYICHQALPILDTEENCFCEPPLGLKQPISLVHLAGRPKIWRAPIHTLEGVCIYTDLRFSTRYPEFEPQLALPQENEIEIKHETR